MLVVFAQLFIHLQFSNLRVEVLTLLSHVIRLRTQWFFFSENISFINGQLLNMIECIINLRKIHTYTVYLQKSYM
jgi:hypothetical protein